MIQQLENELQANTKALKAVLIKKKSRLFNKMHPLLKADLLQEEKFLTDQQFTIIGKINELIAADQITTTTAAEIVTRATAF